MYVYTIIDRVKSERLKWPVAFEMIEVVPFLVLEHFFAQSRTMVAVFSVFLHVSVTFPIVLYIYCLVFVHFRIELHAMHGIGFLIEMDKLQGCVGWVFNRQEFCYLLPDWFPDMISPCVLKVVKILHERVWWQTRACEIGHDSPLVLDITRRWSPIMSYTMAFKLNLVVSMLCHSDRKRLSALFFGKSCTSWQATYFYINYSLPVRFYIRRT